MSHCPDIGHRISAVSEVSSRIRIRTRTTCAVEAPMAGNGSNLAMIVMKYDNQNEYNFVVDHLVAY